MTSKQEKNMNNENDRIESSKWNGKPVIDKILPVLVGVFVFVLQYAEIYIIKDDKDFAPKHIYDLISELIDYGWMVAPLVISAIYTNKSEKCTRSTKSLADDRFGRIFIILVIAFSLSSSAGKAIASILVSYLYEDVKSNPSKENLIRFIATLISTLPILFGVAAFQCRDTPFFLQARLAFFIVVVSVSILWWFGAYSLFEKNNNNYHEI